MSSQITTPKDHNPENRDHLASYLTTCIYKHGWIGGFAEAVAWLGMARWEIAVDHWSRCSAAKRQLAATGLRAAHLTGEADAARVEWLANNA